MVAASAQAGPSSKSIEYYTQSDASAIKGAYMRRRRRRPTSACTCALTLSIFTLLPAVAARAPSFATPTAKPTFSSRLGKRSVPQYWEFVDGQWKLSDDWHLFGVKGNPNSEDLDSAELLQDDAPASDLSTVHAIPTAMSAIAGTPVSSSASQTITQSPSATSSYVAANVSTPAGWTTNRERTAFYAVPLIIVASIIVFCSIFGIIGGVSMRRGRKKALGKARMSEDVESNGSSLVSLEGKARMLALAKRKLRKTKARVVRGGRRKPMVLVVPSEMISSTRLTASALDLQDSGLLRQRVSMSSRRSIRSTASREQRPISEQASDAEEEGEEGLRPVDSRTALTNEDAQSSNHPDPVRRRSIFSAAFSLPASNPQPTPAVRSPPAYRSATQAAATPSYAVATGQASASASTPALTPRQAEKARVIPAAQIETSASMYPELAEEDQEIDRSQYIAHVATDDKAALHRIHSLASAPQNDQATMEGSAPDIQTDHDGFEDHPEWLQEPPAPPMDASSSSYMLPQPSQPISVNYGGLQPVHENIASAPPMMQEANAEDEASAPPIWDGLEEGDVYVPERHAEV